MVDFVDIKRVSVDAGGNQLNSVSNSGVFVPNTNKIIFQSSSDSVVAGDNNGYADLFMKDIVTGEVTRISVSATGAQANGMSALQSVSADGNLVVFESNASNLVAGDTNAKRDIFLKNLATGEVTLVSQNLAGQIGNNNSFDPVISNDGTKVAFATLATNLDTVDGNGRQDIYVKDLTTGVVTFVSSSSTGELSNGTNNAPVFSPDGTKVAFYSQASNLVSGDTNAARDIFVKDLISGETTRVSVNAAGAQGNGGSRAFDPVFSPDGTQVMFRSEANNLVSGDTNGVFDIFIKNLVTGAVTLVSSNALGQFGNGLCTYAAFSPDGSKVVFVSTANNLVPDDYSTNADVFIKDLATGTVKLISSALDGTPSNGDSLDPSFSSDGTKVQFTSFASNLVDGDTNGQVDVFVVTLNPNEAPIVAADYLTATAGQVLTNVSPTLLANDYDIEHDSFSISAVDNDGTVGQVAFDSVTGAVSYTADSAFIAGLAEGETYEDHFGYTVTTGDGATASTVVTVTLTGVNDAPVAVDDALTVDEDQTLVISVASLLANDADVDNGAVLTFVEVVAQPTHGVLVDNGDGTYSYQPAAQYFGSDSFTYKIMDEYGLESEAVANITVASVNDAPVAVDDAIAVTVGDTVSDLIPLVLSNDSDVEGGLLRVSAVHGNNAHGTLTFNNAEQTLSYTPSASYFAYLAAGEQATETFTYTTKDPLNATDIGTVTVTVTGVNDAPVASDNNIAADEDVAKIITIAELLANDVDADTGAVVTFTGISVAPQFGTLTDNGDGTLTYLANPNYNGNDSFSYTIQDEFGEVSTATVLLAVAPVNDLPVAGNDTFSVDEDTPLVITAASLLSNDTDEDVGATLSIDSIDVPPAHGTLTNNLDGTYTYLADPNYSGADSFTYLVRDEFGALVSAVVNIDVIASNVNPEAVNDSATALEDVALVITLASLLANDTDSDGDVVSFDGVESNPAHGTVSVNGDGDLVYLSDANYYGEDSFIYRIADGQGGFSTAQVLLNVLAQNETITGTDNADLLYGTPEIDFIDALDGNDTVYALDSDDTVHAGLGDDLVYAEGGNDSVLAGSGNDTLYGGNGGDYLSGGNDNDLIHGEAGIDVLFGSTGNDTLYGDDDGDTVNGGDDQDELHGGLGSDRLDGDAGNDTLFGDEAGDSLYGGDGNDEQHGGLGNDRLRGDAGNDVLYGEDGEDNMDGSEGNDTLVGGANRDTLVGGAGSDVFLFTARTDSTLSLRDNITDFVNGEDMFDVRGLGYTGVVTSGSSLTQLTVSYSVAADKTYIKDTHSDFQFSLSGNHLSEIGNSDFLF